jgi:rubrerythrin
LSPQEATTSIVIDFAERLEEGSSDFYAALAGKCVENKEQFLSFAEESKKNKILILRTYQETITDALEACFCFKGLNLQDFVITKTLGKDVSCSAALKLAIDNEERAVQFYSTIAILSKGLLATIPMAFKRVAEKRKNRQLTLKSLTTKS